MGDVKEETLELFKIIKKILKGEIEVFTKTVKTFGTSAHILVPRKYIGSEITLIISSNKDVPGERAPSAPEKEKNTIGIEKPTI